MRSAGLSTTDVLKSATVNPAKRLGLKTGVIAKGYMADIVLLNKNPLLNIKNTTTIETVIKEDLVFNLQTLDVMLRDVEELNNKSRTIYISKYLN